MIENGVYVPTPMCLPTFSLTDECSANDAATLEQFAAEQLEIGAPPVNVFRLLGVHEQGRLVDLAVDGNPIASSTATGSIPDQAFRQTAGSWVSGETGAGVLNSFIGYNFGIKTLDNGMTRYETPKPLMRKVSSIHIQQSSDPLTRATAAIIEASNDGGMSWFAVATVVLPDSDASELISFPSAVLAQCWRIRPIRFNGLSAGTSWIVQELAFYDYEKTAIWNIQDYLLNENRDRDYAHESVTIKATYELSDIQASLGRFGIDIPDIFTFVCSFSRMVEVLGRPIITGDIIELPDEIEYDHNLKPVRKFLEVQDGGWASSGYMPNWKPTLYRFTASPIVLSMENRDLHGVMGNPIVDTPFDLLNGDSLFDQRPTKSDAFIATSMADQVPETGIDPRGYDNADGSVPAAFNTFGDRGLYTEDGLPPNNLPYTEGYAFPTTPADGEYYRLLTAGGTNIPPRLFQYSAADSRWQYRETDRRKTPNSHRPSMIRQLNATNKIKMGGDE